MAHFYRDECADCGFPCQGSSCMYKNVLHKICDKCKDDVRYLYDYNGEELCRSCYDDKVIEDLYQAYKEDWCFKRNISLKDIDEEVGVNGECYSCPDEFWMNEGNDDAYILELAKGYGIELNPREVCFENDED